MQIRKQSDIISESAVKPTIKFSTAEEAWFWFMRSEKARAERAKCEKWDNISEKPCLPDDVYRCVAQLYRQDILFYLHLEVMGEYGYLDRYPDTEDDLEAVDWIIWVDAFDTLEPYLIAKGIVECPAQY